MEFEMGCTISPYIFSIYKLKQILPSSALKMIYYSYIHSHIIYLNPIWSGASNQKLNELFILQKRASKISWSLIDFFKLRSCFNTLIHKIAHNHIKHHGELILRSAVHSYEQRSCDQFDIEFFSSLQI